MEFFYLISKTQCNISTKKGVKSLPGFHEDWIVFASLIILQSHYFVLFHCHKVVCFFISTLSHLHLYSNSGLKIKDIYHHMSERVLLSLPHHHRVDIISPE